MTSMAEVLYALRIETEARSRNLQAGQNRGQWAWGTSAASTPRGAMRPGIRQLAVRVDEFVARLRCRLQSRFASKQSAAQPADSRC